MFQNTASQPSSQTNSHELESGSQLVTYLKSEPMSVSEGHKIRITQLEDDLRVLKVSISNVLHAFCALPNTSVSKELTESIERGTISAMVLFLGRLVERLDSYRVQQVNLEEMRGLLEDTSSSNCTLIAEKEMIKDEIIDVLESSDTYEEVKNKLVTLVNRADLGTSPRQSAKKRKMTMNNLVRPTKAKRVRSSQLRSRHPMYEVSSRSRAMQMALESNISASENKVADPDYIIEVSSSDEDSEDSSKKDSVWDLIKVNEKGNATDNKTNNRSLTRNQSPGQGKRGCYSHYDKATKFEIGQYASEHGTCKAVAHFTKTLGHKVSESTVRGMVQQYNKGQLKAEYDIEMETGNSEDNTAETTQTSAEPDSCDMKEENAEKTQHDTMEQVNDNHKENTASTSDSGPHWSALVSGPGKRKRGQYNHYDEVLRAGIGRYAQTHGVTNAQRHFHEDLGAKVSESTIRSMRDQYRKLKEKGTADLSVLPVNPRGAPMLLGYLDKKVQKWVHDTRMQGGLINTSVVVAAADNIVMRFAKHKLKRFGGDITITKNYARSLLNRMGLVKHRNSNRNVKMPNDFDVIKTNFISRLKSVVSENIVPETLIINWNQISCQLVPGGNWESENSDAGSAPVISTDDKRQISVILGITMSGKLLPPQIIYSGKTDRCLPKDVNFPREWSVTYSDSQLGNEGTMLQYIHKIILPYIRGVRESLPTRAKVQQAVALFDAEETNNSQTLFKTLKDNHITIEFVPVKCKEHLQPIDLSVKEVFYNLMKQQFSEWYTKELQSRSDDTGAAIDMRTAHLKPLHAYWIMNAHKDLEKRNDLIRMGFTKVGLLDDNLGEVTSSSDATVSTECASNNSLL